MLNIENLELAMKTDKRVWKSLMAWLVGDERDKIADTLRLIRLDGEADRQAGLSRMARSNGWKSACC